jgi:hypothetical protein
MFAVQIMAVDDCEYDKAEKVQQTISQQNRAANMLYKLPYTVGITLAVAGGLASFPMVR